MKTLLHLWPQRVWPFQKKSPRSESAKPFLKPLNTIITSKPTQSKKSCCDAIKSCPAGHPGKHKRWMIPCCNPKPEWDWWQLCGKGDSGTQQLPGWEQPFAIWISEHWKLWSQLKACQEGREHNRAAPCHPHSSFIGNVWGKIWTTPKSRHSVPSEKEPGHSTSSCRKLHIQIFKIPIWCFWWILSDDEFMFPMHTAVFSNHGFVQNSLESTASDRCDGIWLSLDSSHTAEAQHEQANANCPLCLVTGSNISCFFFLFKYSKLFLSPLLSYLLLITTSNSFTIPHFSAFPHFYLLLIPHPSFHFSLEVWHQGSSSVFPLFLGINQGKRDNLDITWSNPCFSCCTSCPFPLCWRFKPNPFACKLHSLLNY